MIAGHTVLVLGAGASTGSDDARLTEKAKVVVEVRGYDRVYLREAERCVVRAQRANERNDADEQAGATTAAVLLAAAACEGRLSESLAAHRDDGKQLPAHLAAVASAYGVPEKWKEFLKASGHVNVCGGEKYRNLKCLFDLRNLIAHRNAAKYSLGEIPDVIKECVEAGRIPIHHISGHEWTSVVHVHEIAEWSVGVAGWERRPTGRRGPTAGTPRRSRHSGLISMFSP